MAEELMVVLKRNENCGFGFSLLGTAGLPHVIYDIVEHSPAAECGQVEAGDVIVKVNGTDVHRFSTKEVLKCLRLSDDLVTLELKRDPKVKANVRHYLAHTTNPHQPDVPLPPLTDIWETSSSASPSPVPYDSDRNHYSGGNSSSSSSSSQRLTTSDPSQCRKSRIPQAVRSSSKSAPQSPQGQKIRTSHIPTPNGTNNSSHNNHHHLHQQQQQQPTNQPPAPNTKARFEAYMMTGDLILNLSRTPQSLGLVSHSKKVDSLRDSPVHKPHHSNNVTSYRNGAVAPHAKGESSPSSPSQSESTDSANSKKSRHSERSANINDFHSGSDGGHTTTRNNRGGAQNRHNIAENNIQYTNDDDDVDAGIGYGGGGVSSRQLMNDFDECLASIKNTTTTAAAAAASEQPNNHSDSNNGCTNNSRQLTTHDPHHRPQHHHSSTSSSSTVKSEATNSLDGCYSVPTSPTSLSTPIAEGICHLKHKESANSVPTSPDSGAQEIIRRQQHHPQQQQHQQQQQQQHNGIVRKCDSAGFRTSRSEDHLQQTQRDGGLGAVIPIDIDEDVNSSLNTLLDTRQDSEDSQSSDRDRIVWTYNAPVPNTTAGVANSSNSHSHSSSISSSPQRSDSPASPTSVSSSVMSSNSGSKGAHSAAGAACLHSLMCPINGGDHSVSEAVSNISSPDYQDDDNLLSSKDMAMAISDPSDSDSTILVSEAYHHQQHQHSSQHHHHSANSRHNNKDTTSHGSGEHKIVIQVRGAENGGNSPGTMSSQGYAELTNSEDELATLTEDPPTVMAGNGDGRESSPPVSDDGSDVESLHSYHYSPKAVDIPSAVRLAKRLYGLDGFKKSDVSRHLSKNNDFSRAVADEYLKYFNFDKSTLDEALRQFLQQFALSGETQERERVLVHFSRRYLDCNPGTFNSQDAVHTLTCAIMLLNTDLHGQNIGRKMTCTEFIDNLAELNDGENFPKDVLKFLYQAIKSHPLEWALDDELADQQSKARSNENSIQGPPVGPNPFLDTPHNSAAIEYKKGYVMRKCCYDSNYKKTPFGKRSWKMFYCTLRDLVLYLHKDEHGFRKSQMSDNVHNAIRIHHALATKANDYTKKLHVFRLQTADQSEFLFQTSDSKELQSWIDTINFVCASFSAPPLEGGVGSQKRFQRPLLPSSHTKFLMREQLTTHEERVQQLETTLEEHRRSPTPNKGLPLQNFKEKEAYLLYELKRYKTYVYILGSRIIAEQQQQQSDLQNCLLPPDDASYGLNNPIAMQAGPQQQQPPPPLQQQLQNTAASNRNDVNIEL